MKTVFEWCSMKPMMLAVFTGLFALMAFYATYKLTESPPTWYDEGMYIQVAHSFGTRGTQSLQVAPNEFRQVSFLTLGYPVIAPVAASMKILGDTLFAARVPMAIFIFLFGLAAWTLIRRIVSMREAMFGLLLLSTFPPLYGEGKNVLGEVPGLFFMTLALLALHRLETKNFAGAWNYVLLGCAVGLTAATKPIFLLLPVTMVFVLLFHARSIPWRPKEMAIGILAFGIPMLLWAYLQFGSEVTPSTILGYYANPYGVTSVTNTVLQNLLRFFKEATPLYFGTLMCIWLLSFLIRAFRAQKISLAEQSAFIFSILVLTAYLRTAGWYRYFFEAMTLALIFATSSLRVIFDAFFNSLKLPQKYSAYVPAVIVVGLATMQFYQLNFSSWVANHYESIVAADTTRYFSSYPKDRSIFVYNSPEAVPLLQSDAYYQYLQPTEAISYGKEELPLLVKGIPDDVLIAPERYAAHPELFARYHKSGTAGPYLILSK